VNEMNKENGSQQQAILGSEELKKRLFHKDIKERLVISPLISDDFADGTIDIRLGTKYIMTQRTQIPSIDPIESEQEDIYKFLQRVDLPIGSNITIHPRMLILAATLEYICLPLNLCASVVTRSTYGRLGLLSATAVHVHPGFRGCLTLELVNFGDTAILLYPGIRIAQLIIYNAGDCEAPEAPKYHMVTEPEFPKLWKERDRKVLRYLKKRAENLKVSSTTFF
jgi:dCTP deaminase